MPTTKPRINLTLRPTLATTIRRLSELQGNSMSRTIVDLLEVAEPALQRTAAAIEAVRNLEGEARTSMLATVLRELRHLEELQLSTTGQADMFTEMERRTLEAVEKQGAIPAIKPQLAKRGRRRVKRAKPK